MFPPPSMTEDLASNWEFLKDNLKDYATETKLDQKDKKYLVRPLRIFGRECLQVCSNLLVTEDERDNLILFSGNLTSILWLNEIQRARYKKHVTYSLANCNLEGEQSIILEFIALRLKMQRFPYSQPLIFI